MEYKFSVIIPVYNAESTLSRCVDSLLLQNYRQTEIILVNDGSSDQSGQLCEEYVQKYSNVVYISQKNAGASSARNTGLSAATGEYILFVDSDDYVENGYFAALEKDNADFVTFPYKAIRTGEITKISFGEKLVSAETYSEIVLEVLKNRLAGPWNKRYKRSIIENKKIRFREDLIIGEDFLFGLEYMLACQTATVKTEYLYCVDETGMDSITRSAKYSFSQFLRIYEYAFRVAEESKWTGAEKEFLWQMLDFLYCRTLFACMERYIAAKLDKHISPSQIVMMFYEQRRINICPHNKAHAIMRFCINKKCVFMVYIVAYMHLKMKRYFN